MLLTKQPNISKMAKRQQKLLFKRYYLPKAGLMSKTTKVLRWCKTFVVFL